MPRRGQHPVTDPAHPSRKPVQQIFPDTHHTGKAGTRIVCGDQAEWAGVIVTCQLPAYHVGSSPHEATGTARYSGNTRDVSWPSAAGIGRYY